MWVLIVMLIGTQPNNLSYNSGSIKAVMQSKEHCMQIKENIERNWNIDKYRVKAGCSFIAHL